MAGYLAGVSFTMWAFGTWWIPLLVMLGFWRHVRRRWPLAYEPGLWAIVFPLGMYAVAMLLLGQVTRLSVTEPLSRVMTWVAVVAWAGVAGWFVIRLAGRRAG